MSITERESSSLSELARQSESTGVDDGEQPRDAAKKESPPPSTPAPDSQPQPRPSLVPLGSSQSSSSTTTTPKKFSAVTIGKKYLEKNAQAANTSSNSATNQSKTSAAAVRPAIQPSQTHSRLVSAKLTATPFASSPAGWPRPSSVAPTSTPGNNSVASSLPNSNSSSPAPQKSSQQKEPGKPVWGTVKPTVRPDIRQDDFPTAAEVAKAASKAAKAEEAKTSPEIAKPSPSRVEDGDAFRGLHLDPNAHHWDEVDEDDDDFLGGVVEFGDGRQYKVEAVDETKLESNQVQDRFADDFDRSWPKSATSPALSHREALTPASAHPRELPRSPAVSTTGLHASPRDSSRVLFNERSNRLEPYSNQRQQGPPPTGRGDFGNVRVLHKPPGFDPAPRNRRFSGASNGSSGGAFSTSPRDSTFGRRDAPPPSPRMQRDAGLGMAPTRSWGGRERDSVRGSMGPPPVPAHALKVAQASGRPLPPHLAQAPDAQPQPNATLTPRGAQAPSLPAQSPRSVAAPLSPTPAQAAAVPIALSGVDEETARKELMQTAAARAKARREQEEAEREAQKERARRKALEIEERMKAAAEAEKAKQAEAEAEKARQAEAAKPPAPEPAQATPSSQSALVNSIIEDAVKSVQPPPPKSVIIAADANRDFPRRSQAAPANISPKLKTTFAAKVAPPPAQQQTSWRSAKSVSPVVPTPPVQPRAPAPAAQPAAAPPVRRASSGFVASATPALDAAVAGVKGDLEVVDFADMAKLMNGTPPEVSQSPTDAARPVSAKTPRAVASDFFDDTPPRPAERPNPEENAWRRKALIVQTQKETSDEPQESDKAKEISVPQESAASVPPTPAVSVPKAAPPPISVKVPEAKPEPSPVPSATKETLTYPEPANGRTPVNIPSQAALPPRPPRSQPSQRDTGLSSLDHAMSRIKGAMTDMKAHEEVSPESPTTASKSSFKSATRDRWMPPALRPKTVGFVDEENHEVFTVTAEPPPHQSPIEATTPSTVKLPSTSTRRDPVRAFQLKLFYKPSPPVRFEVLSFSPPVEGMTKREFSVNAVLFRRPKGPFKPRVSIPRYRGPRPFAPGSRPPPPVGPFGKSTVADNASSWRKAAIVQAAQDASAADAAKTLSGQLDTMSGSPPPDITQPKAEIAANIPKSNVASSSPQAPEQHLAPRHRPEPKMPAGSGVAFRRDSRIDVVSDNLTSSVNFFAVEEEIQEPQVEVKSSPKSAPFVPEPVETVTAIAEVAHPEPKTPVSRPSGLSAPTSIADKSPSLSHQHSPWRSPVNHSAKSDSRGPDPEHLKALWSQPQPSDKTEQIRTVNSLEGIADDLTSLPFTFPVKSDEGATPPPNVPQAPSRMSLHEVTRAFQQVPQPSTTTTVPPRPAISPPSTNAPVARPTPAASTPATTTAPANPGYSYTPMPLNLARPSYHPQSYPSPLMSHSPAPGMMYSPHPMGASPVPGRMPVSSHTPLYGQSMWMPIQGQPGSGMRPSPYPAQMMTYGGPQAAAYNPQVPLGPPHGMHPMGQQQPMANGVGVGGPGNRGGNRNPAISPIMSHAQMYHHHQVSPMLVHASMVPAQQHAAAYQPMPNGRAQPPRAGGDGASGAGNSGGSGSSGQQGHLNQQQQQQQQQPPHLMYAPNLHAQSTPQSYGSRTGW